MKTFSIEYRVIYGDCDPFDVVYYANYLNYFERGRTEFFRELGVTYRQVQDMGIFLPVSEVWCKYHRSARYDDLLLIETEVAYLKKASIRFNCRIYRKQEKELITEGHTIHAFVNREGKIKRAPPEVAERLKRVIGD